MILAGIDIGGTAVKIGLVDEAGALTDAASIPAERDPALLCARIRAELARLPHRAEAIGVGAAGRVDTALGTVYAGNLGWHAVPLRDLMREATGLPVHVDNDAQAALMAEWRYGALRGLTDAVYITLGTGIGGALLLDGRLYRGYQNGGGELGHMITHAGGIPCTCGMDGCFERYASAGALSRLGGGRSAREIINAARAGDEESLAAFRAYAYEVAIGLASIQLIFAPQKIAIGGGISGAGELLLEAVDEAMQKVMVRRAKEGYPRIALAAFLNDAGMIGAAEIARAAMREDMKR